MAATQEPSGTQYVLLGEDEDGTLTPLGTTRLRPSQASREKGEGVYVAVALSSWQRVIVEARITARAGDVDFAHLPEIVRGGNEPEDEPEDEDEAAELAAAIEDDE